MITIDINLRPKDEDYKFTKRIFPVRRRVCVCVGGGSEAAC